MLRSLLFSFLLVGPVFAKNETAGEFDYYVLALSWTPSWCAYEGDKRGSPQCDAGRDFGFTLHGLWPQNEKGWPSYCPTTYRTPSKAMTNAMTDIMGSSGLAWHQWRKHGVCTGLSPEDYFALSRKAYEAVRRPEVLQKLPRVIAVPAQVVEDAILDSNPDMRDETIQLTCKANRIQEARICLTKDLEPRACSRDLRDCTLKDAEMAPIR